MAIDVTFHISGHCIYVPEAKCLTVIFPQSTARTVADSATHPHGANQHKTVMYIERKWLPAGSTAASGGYESFSLGPNHSAGGAAPYLIKGDSKRVHRIVGLREPRAKLPTMLDQADYSWLAQAKSVKTVEQVCAKFSDAGIHFLTMQFDSGVVRAEHAAPAFKCLPLLKGADPRTIAVGVSCAVAANTVKIEGPGLNALTLKKSDAHGSATDVYIFNGPTKPTDDFGHFCSLVKTCGDAAPTVVAVDRRGEPGCQESAAPGEDAERPASRAADRGFRDQMGSAYCPGLSAGV